MGIDNNNRDSTMKKKIDSRIQTLIENGYKSNQRTMLMVVGDRARYQVVNFHFMLSRLGSQRAKPKVLWCYKNELEFSSHQKKRIKQIKNLQMKGLYDESVDDPFDLFVSSNDIRYTYYKESHKILGNTFQMLVLQDFEALTPNLLCRTLETVQGGGLILFLLRTMTSLKQLYTIVMDAHQRYRTDAFTEVEPRFNERFILSLSKNKNCIVMDDELNILPISEHINQIQPVEERTIIDRKAQEELNALKKTLEHKELIGKLVSTALTLDQAKVVMSLVDSLADKHQKYTVSLTAGRGRGKSASVGLALAAAVQMGFGSIFVTAPSPDNLKTLFEFVETGLELLDYKLNQDYSKVFSSNKQLQKAVIRIDISKHHNQFIQFIFPNDADKIGYSDLVVIDEAAAIPLPYVKSFFGPHHLLMASTINGYEGTGRSLSLKLIEEIRRGNAQSGQQLNSFKKFRELTMTDPIRYALNDEIERWLNELLLLNATEPVPLKGQRLPHPSECQLYIVNRDTLFSYKANSERFLFNLMSLFISSHYKNSPNDLQLLSDSPSHLVFVLLGPLLKNHEGKVELPDVLCAVQVALEGNLSSLSINQNSERGIKPSGDLIPWNIREQYQNSEFPQLAGGRVVRIATHAKAVKMGYGSRALQQLADFFEGKLISFDKQAEIVEYNFRGEGVRKPLLKKVEEVRPPRLHYLGTSFGFTETLLKFWRKNQYQPVYLRQSVNDITSEHSGIMLRPLDNEHKMLNIEVFVQDFKKRLTNLLGCQFRKLSASLALEILHIPRGDSLAEDDSSAVGPEVLSHFVSLTDLNRLKSYCKNQVDFHLIMDLVPGIARLYFTGVIGSSLNLGYLNQLILIGLGLQFKTFEEICKEVRDLQVKNALPVFQKTVIKFTKIIEKCYQKEIENQLPAPLSAALNRALPHSTFQHHEQIEPNAELLDEPAPKRELPSARKDHSASKAEQGQAKKKVKMA